MAAGYSANPLYKKLGLKEGDIIKLINAPAKYKELIGDLYAKLYVANKATTDLNFIHFFTNSLKELEKQLPLLMQQIRKDGSIWVSWYKKSAAQTSELTENVIRDTALAMGLVDVKVCAIDEQWSGLKLVYRLKDR
ncbi:hypothetical protein ACFSPU_01150 [Haoranjiania flava]|uniref:DUF3052 domain-containing protein n=1 Tax=Haoranjiania flava TaxID=1856322 RepID=A0AAE3LPW2_9BACT|nr:hypothetical protein [Haoranjiania flava]MCU7693900.1 hypothetical protein [Haoranjiania flava]